MRGMTDLNVGVVWRDVLADIRQHITAYATLAAAFVFLPALVLAAVFARSLAAVSAANRAALAAFAAGGGGAGAAHVDPATLLGQISFPPGYGLAFVLVLLLQLTGQFTINAIAGDAGRPATETVGATLARVIPRVGKYLLMLVILGLALAVTAILVIVLASIIIGIVVAGVLAAGGAKSVAFTLGLLLVLTIYLPLIWVSVRLILLPVVYAVEPVSLFGGIDRAWQLSRDRFWRLLGLLMLVLLAAVVVSLPLSLLSGSASPSQAIAPFLFAKVIAEIIAAAFAMVFAVVLGIIYRRLARTTAPPA